MEQAVQVAAVQEVQNMARCHNKLKANLILVIVI